MPYITDVVNEYTRHAVILKFRHVPVSLIPESALMRNSRPLIVKGFPFSVVISKPIEEQVMTVFPIPLPIKLIPAGTESVEAHVAEPAGITTVSPERADERAAWTSA